MAMYKNDVSDYHPTFFALVDKKFKVPLKGMQISFILSQYLEIKKA